MTPLYEYWNTHYINAARNAYPDVCANHELAVGFKLTRKDGTAHNGYYWPLVNANHDLPVLHESTAWDNTNTDSCPRTEGDGLCLVPQGQPVCEASSGGVRLTEGVGHVLVYPTKLAKGASGKRRSPWVIDMDCFDPIEMIRLGGCPANLSGVDLSGADLSGVDLSGADLSRANLSGADLSGVDLSGVDLYMATLSGATLSGVDLSGATLSGVDLYMANLSGANLSGADLYRANLSGVDLSGVDLSGVDLSGANADRFTRWPAGFDVAGHGVNDR